MITILKTGGRNVICTKYTKKHLRNEGLGSKLQPVPNFYKNLLALCVIVLHSLNKIKIAFRIKLESDRRRTSI